MKRFRTSEALGNPNSINAFKAELPSGIPVWPALEMRVVKPEPVIIHPALAVDFLRTEPVNVGGGEGGGRLRYGPAVRIGPIPCLRRLARIHQESHVPVPVGVIMVVPAPSGAGGISVRSPQQPADAARTFQGCGQVVAPGCTRLSGYCSRSVPESPASRRRSRVPAPDSVQVVDQV